MDLVVNFSIIVYMFVSHIVYHSLMLNYPCMLQIYDKEHDFYLCFQYIHISFIPAAISRGWFVN